MTGIVRVGVPVRALRESDADMHVLVRAVRVKVPRCFKNAGAAVEDARGHIAGDEAARRKDAFVKAMHDLQMDESVVHVRGGTSAAERAERRNPIGVRSRDIERAIG